MYRKLPRLDKSEQRGFKQTKRPQRGQKCCQRVERNRSPSPTPAGGPVAKPEITRSGRVPLLAPEKRGWPPTSLGRGAWGVTRSETETQRRFTFPSRLATKTGNSYDLIDSIEHARISWGLV